MPKKKCPTCKGTGKEVIVLKACPSIPFMTDTCPTCHGDGEVYVKPTVKRMRKIAEIIKRHEEGNKEELELRTCSHCEKIMQSEDDLQRKWLDLPRWNEETDLWLCRKCFKYKDATLRRTLYKSGKW